MKTKTMSALLRAVLLAAGLLLAVFFFLFLPFYGKDTVRCAGVCLGLLAVPCLGVGVCRADLLGHGPGVAGLRQHCCKGYGLHREKCP